MFITIYISEKFRQYSEKSYDQGGVFYLDISEDERDLCKILNGNDLECMYPKWDELPLCFHKDWKLINSWQLTEGTSKEYVEHTFSKIFYQPEIIQHVRSTLEIYSVKVHDIRLNLPYVRSRLSNIYCLNRETHTNLWWCFDGNDDSYVDLIQNILLDMVQRLCHELADDSRKETFLSFQLA